MAQQHPPDEVYTSFLAALVRTVNDVERAQPEPGFGSLFMDLLKTNLEYTALAAAKQDGYDIHELLMSIHANLHRMFYVQSIGDVLSEEG